MPRFAFNSEVDDLLAAARQAAQTGNTQTVTVDNRPVTVPPPFPSPMDWRDHWIYFLMLDRFNNPHQPPAHTWNQIFDFRQGGTFKGVEAQLDYLHALGVGAIWITPVVKNPRPDFQYNYHGYAAQDFLNIDERFASDGTRETAETELAELVQAAHARGIYVILDIVLNHGARVFDYVLNGQTEVQPAGEWLMNAPLGAEPPVQWLNGFGFPRADWENQLPGPEGLSDDDAVWPAELQNHLFFRRRGQKLTDDPDQTRFVRGDFAEMRQLVVEYDARPAGQEAVREALGTRPVLNTLIRAYSYLVARYDFDGFRIDTVKYVDPDMVQTFGNALREFALSIGKKNFFTFGEIYDDEFTIANFVGRNGTGNEGFGIDAALDFPLFGSLPAMVKGNTGPEAVRRVFDERKAHMGELLSTHGEAGRFFVSFLDNHDQHERFNHPQTPPNQVTQALALLFTLQGIPSLYYGTEQGLQGTTHLGDMESVREALWGRPQPFDQNHVLFQEIQALAQLRRAEPALRYGRLYFRQVSGNGQDFGHSNGVQGVLAFARILADREVLVIANTHSTETFTGWALIDRNLNRPARTMAIAHSNQGTQHEKTVEMKAGALFHDPAGVSTGEAAALPVVVQPGEVQVWIPK